MPEQREIVVPGEHIGAADEFRPGLNTYVEGRGIYALRLGVKSLRGDQLNIISLSGRYEPQRGDMVIGTVAEAGPSNWYINIGAANDVGMHVNDVPWRVEFGETTKFLDIGDTVLLKIVHVDELKKAQVSMKDRQCRKLTGGILLEVAPSKVPRIVGRSGSMIGMLKDATNVRLFVGQNGVIWLDGEPDDVRVALEALRKIEAEAHTTGLTDRMKAWLEERRPSAQRVKREMPEDEAVEEDEEEERPPRERRERREPRPRRDEEEEASDDDEDEDEGARPRPKRAASDDEEDEDDGAPRRAPSRVRAQDSDEGERRESGGGAGGRGRGRRGGRGGRGGSSGGGGGGGRGGSGGRGGGGGRGRRNEE